MDTQPNLTILFFGDVVGRPGRRVIRRFLRRCAPRPDLVIVNVENAAHGYGVTELNLQELKEVGVNVFTGGNHTFDRKEIFSFIENEPTLLRPANYPPGTPGRGSCVVELPDGGKVAVLNLMGRIFMDPLASPYLVADEQLELLRKQTNVIFVDMHAEATAEKISLAWYIDGRASVLAGTHTHVQTADERILPQGLAYITDVGCCGAADGVIGMDREAVFRRMIQQLPARLDVASGPANLCGVRVVVDRQSGKALSIERIFIRETLEESAEDDK